MNTWVWGTTVFRAKSGHKVGINISMSEKNQDSSGDAMFIDGKLYKLDALVVTKKSQDLWTIESYQGEGVKFPNNQVKMTFEVKKRHKIYKNIFIIEIDFNSNYGFFSGSVKSEDGHYIEFDNRFGFVEEMFSRW